MIRRVAIRVVGLALVGVCLYLAGWSDRVEAADGTVHHGTIFERSDDRVSIETESGPVEVAIEHPDRAREGLRSALRRFRRQPGPAALAALLYAAGMLLGFFRWGLLLRGAGISATQRDVMRFGWAGQFFSNLLPGGTSSGDLAKAFLAAHAAGGGKTRAVLSVIADRLVGVLVLSGVAGVALLTAPAGSPVGVAGRVIAIVFAVCVVILALLLWPALRRRLGVAWAAARLPGRIVILELAAVAKLYGARLGLVAGTAGLALCGQVLMLTSLWYLGGAVGTWMGWAAVGVALPVALLVSAVPALPGGWGVGDAAFFFFLTGSGVPGGHALAISFLFRILHLLVSLPGAWMVGARERAEAEKENVS